MATDVETARRKARTLPLPSGCTALVRRMMKTSSGGSIQKLVFKDLMALARGMEGELENDVKRAESLLAWAEKFEKSQSNPNE